MLKAPQYTEAVLLQDFQDSPHLFGNMLSRKLRELSPEERTLAIIC